MKRMEHDWFKVYSWWDDATCKRCGLIETERERNLSASQSTELYATYWREGKSYGRTDPGCVERD